MNDALRTFDLEDIAIRADGTGRTVVAYAAVFTPYPVVDLEGDYDETILPTAFDRSLGQGLGRLRVLFNHGRTVDGATSERYSMPLGTPLEVRADNRGLLTVTRYAKTPLADEVLELVREGAIRGQSFSGRWMNSQPIKAARAGGRDAIIRREVALREYGPAPFPVAQGAEIMSVRSVADLANEVAGLTVDERAELARIISGTPATPAPLEGGTDGTDPPDTGEAPEPAAATTPPDITPEVELDRRRRLLLLAS